MRPTINNGGVGDLLVDQQTLQVGRQTAVMLPRLFPFEVVLKAHIVKRDLTMKHTSSQCETAASPRKLEEQLKPVRVSRGLFLLLLDVAGSKQLIRSEK